MGKYRVLLILHLPPPVHGASMVGKYIHDSHLINETFDCRYINLTTASSLEDIGKISLNKFKAFVVLLNKIYKEVISYKPDVVYVTANAKGGPFYKDFLVVQMLKSLGCKVVVHYHNKGVRIRQNRWLDDKLYRLFFKNLKVILLAETLYIDIEKYVERNSVFICPNGIPDVHIDFKEKHHQIPKLLFLSNLLIDKGVLVLLDALKILKDRGVLFVCDFIGGETKDINANRFAEEVKLRGLEKFAVYYGKKYGVEKEQILNNADLFVFPTYYDNECFPLVLLEAMQHKIPCIATDEGGINSIVINNITGIITQKRNPLALADAIFNLINNKVLAKEMGEKGYEKYKKEFTLDVFEYNFVKVIDGVFCVNK